LNRSRQADPRIAARIFPVNLMQINADRELFSYFLRHRSSELFMRGRTSMIRSLLRLLLKSRTGPTAIEYGLIAALIAIAMIGGLSTLGTNLNTLYNTISTNVGS
jgi:pilus assembly protein Flp/PilA